MNYYAKSYHTGRKYGDMKAVAKKNRYIFISPYKSQ